MGPNRVIIPLREDDSMYSWAYGDLGRTKVGEEDEVDDGCERRKVEAACEAECSFQDVPASGTSVSGSGSASGG